MQTAIEQAQLDFDAPMPSAAHEDASGRAAASWVNPQHGTFAITGDAILAPDGAGSFTVGCKVYLRACAFGQPGRVLRIERGKLAVLWADLGPSYIGRHSPDSLMLAGTPERGTA
jgi:hypothetical protein